MRNRIKRLDRFEGVRLQIVYDKGEPLVAWLTRGRFPTMQAARYAGRYKTNGLTPLLLIDYPEELGINKEKIRVWFIENFTQGNFYIVLDHEAA